MNHVFVVRELNGGVLIPLSEIVSRVGFLDPWCWALKNMTIVGETPFGLDTLQLEKLTRNFDLGFVVSNLDLDRFLKADIQIIDGVIMLFSKSRDVLREAPTLFIECVDSSIWEITTGSEAVANELKIQGFTSDES